MTPIGEAGGTAYFRSSLLPTVERSNESAGKKITSASILCSGEMQDVRGLAAGAAPASAAAAAAAGVEAAEWMGTLESSRYRLWLRTFCTLHSKWPPLLYHLWIINVQSVGLSFAIGHSNTVQFASHTYWPRRRLRVPPSNFLPSPSTPSPCPVL